LPAPARPLEPDIAESAVAILRTYACLGGDGAIFEPGVVAMIDAFGARAWTISTAPHTPLWRGLRRGAGQSATPRTLYDERSYKLPFPEGDIILMGRINGRSYDDQCINRRGLRIPFARRFVPYLWVSPRTIALIEALFRMGRIPKRDSAEKTDRLPAARRDNSAKMGDCS
jgi:hypothetical protein